MILVYPMLTSASVNPTILPGLIKSIENYIVIYNTNEMLSHFNTVLADVVKAGVTGAVTAGASAAVAAAIAGKAKSRIIVKGKRLELKEQIRTSSKYKEPPTGTEKIATAAGKAIERAGERATVKDFKVDTRTVVSLEPTWVQVNTSSGTKVVGVKVVAFKVTSTTNMVGLLMSDKELRGMDLMAEKFGRSVIRMIFRGMRGLRIPGFKDKPITGNPKTDVVWATSQYGKNAFICLSRLDLEDEQTFASPTVVQRLHQLGWASLIFTDDVNKQATFCMKQFGGVCSTIPYSFIFASLGREHGQVYKDMEEAQRSAGPFFRKKSTTKRKIISQGMR